MQTIAPEIPTIQQPRYRLDDYADRTQWAAVHEDGSIRLTATRDVAEVPAKGSAWSDPPVELERHVSLPRYEVELPGETDSRGRKSWRVPQSEAEWEMACLALARVMGQQFDERSGLHWNEEA